MPPRLFSGLPRLHGDWNYSLLLSMGFQWGRHLVLGMLGIFWVSVMAVQGLHAQPARVRILQEELSGKTADTARARLLATIAYLYTDIDLDSALRYAERAEAEAALAGNPISKGYAMISLGRTYMHSGNYDLSLKYLNQALSIFEDEGVASGRGLASLNLALVYAYLQNVPYSERYARETYGIAEKTKDSFLLVSALLKYCDNHASTNRTDSLAIDARRAFALARQIGDTNLWARASSYVGLAFEINEQPDSLMAYRSLSLDLNLRNGDNRGVAQDYFYFARLHQLRQQPDSAIYYARLCRDIAHRHHFLFVERNALWVLSEIFETRNSDSALAYFKEYFHANETLYGVRQNQQINSVELNKLKLDQALEEERKQARGKLILGVIAAMLGVALLAGFFLYRNFRAKHRINLELNQTIENLQSAQHQLVHAEKMASLGELTAGIAHEIQNPLNFVSNFAEINAELVDDLQKAVAQGDTEEIRQLAVDIKSNEEKIREHGKRADSIVKSMLQHSRISSGQKEPTDINSLCDEYVRLAYHGMRAKDKNFNVSLKTFLSNGLPEVPVIRQDIGRVILNIVNNAFHAVMEKSQSAPAGYAPTVTIKSFIPADTRIVAGKATRMVCVSIADNGTGIPDALRKKIFQPFFTTKPTGQGTGLGLSLSYDLVKAHGGELVLESVAGEGTTFIIQLPIA